MKIAYMSIAIFLAILLFGAANTDTGRYNDGVKSIEVTDHSEYTIDTRTNLCFYEVSNSIGMSVVQVPCEALEGLK